MINLYCTFDSLWGGALTRMQILKFVKPTTPLLLIGSSSIKLGSAGLTSHSYKNPTEYE